MTKFLVWRLMVCMATFISISHAEAATTDYRLTVERVGIQTWGASTSTPGGTL